MGNLGNLGDGPEQVPQDKLEIDHLVVKLLPVDHYDLLIIHNPTGEYARHLRHEETAHSVIRLWCEGKIAKKKLIVFAYVQ
jgi:hypothetical protein